MKIPVQDWMKRAGELLRRFKYPALVLLIGLVLLLIPGKRQKTETAPAPAEPAETTESDADYLAATERALAAILSQVDGAGKVSVMLTLRCGPTQIYQSDLDKSSQSGESSSTATQQTTVILHRDGAYDEAAVVRTEYPVFAGALIVSEGAGDASVRLALMDAVSALLGLGADKITVVKMK